MATTKHILQSDFDLEMAALSPIEQWAYSLLAKNDSDPIGNLSRFGLKTAADVTRFFRSPEGINVLAELNLQLEIEKQLALNQQLTTQEHNIALSRLKSALFLSFIKEKAHADTQQKEIIIQQTLKAINESGKIPDAAKALATPYRIVLQNAATDYMHALEINKQFSQINDQEAQELLDEIKALERYAAEIELKYTNFARALDDISFDDFDLDKVEAMIEQKRTQIDQFIIQDKDAQASALMSELIILFAQVDSFKDHNAVEDNLKFYVDEAGFDVDSYSKAFYILDVVQTPDPNNPQQFIAQKPKIIKDELGNYYLLKPGQKWDLVKDNVALKEVARKDFESQRPNLTVTKQAVRQNKILEVEDNTARTAQNQLKISENQAVKLALHNQNLMLSAALAQTNTLLNNPNLDSVKPMPVPTGNAASPKPSLSAASIKAAQYYREQLVVLRKNSINYANVVELRNGLMLRGDTPRVTALNFLLQNIPRTGPIPFLTMQSLIKNLELIGVDPTNPAVTPLKGPLELAINPTEKPAKAPKAAVAPDEPEVPHKRPTPFKTNPFE